jgi:hypothetical protein
MFCDQCGAALQAGQQRCARCGKEVIRRVEAVYVQKNRVQEHVRLLGILWMAYSALFVIGGIILVVIANTLFGRFSQAGPPPEVTSWLRPFLTVIGYLILAKAAAGLITGWGLLDRQPWGRILALVVGFISLFSIPIGTALGVYTLWVLLPARSDEEYRAFSQAQAA